MNNFQTSTLWYKVSDLKPEIKSNITIQRQEYRQQTWYIFKDQSNGKHHRFNKISHQLMGLMNGENSLQEIWKIMQDEYDDKAPTQDEIIQISGRLYSAEIIQCEITPDSAELFERYQQHKCSHWKNSLKNPLSLRIPLIDPNNFLDRFKNFSKFIFTKIGLVIWLVTIISALVLATSHWAELTGSLSDRLLTTNNLLLIAFLYPVIKTIHELGHALATKFWGGEVHEMGIMFLVLLPNPYVNTTSAWSFDQKYQRVFVSAAGMVFELFIAALALFFWLMVEPGLARAIAFNIMIISSVTTLIFNLNPLLKFDGYYILSDLIDIPNLAQRSNQYLTYLIKRYLFGLRNTSSPAMSTGEKKWFLIYGILAFTYRLFILVAITLFIASKFFVIGILLAIWACLTQVISPIIKQVNYLFRSPSLGNKRRRAIVVSGTMLCSIMIVVFLIPVPTSTMTQGIVRLPEQSEIRIESSGFVKQVLIANGTFVKAGTPLLKNHDPILLVNEKIEIAKLNELVLKLHALKNERSKAEITRDEISNVRAKLDRISDQKNKLLVTSKNDGVFTLITQDDLTDRYLRKGDLIGYVISPSTMTTRVVLPQQDMEPIKSVEIKLATDLSRSIPATIIREVPASSNFLPSPALGSMGGGPFVTNPQDTKGLETLEPIFHLDISIEGHDNDLSKYIGGRVFAKFKHENKPLAQHWYRSIRQLFLSRFDV